MRAEDAPGGSLFAHPAISRGVPLDLEEKRAIERVKRCAEAERGRAAEPREESERDDP